MAQSCLENRFGGEPRVSLWGCSDTQCFVPLYGKVDSMNRVIKCPGASAGNSGSARGIRSFGECAVRVQVFAIDFCRLRGASRESDHGPMLHELTAASKRNFNSPGARDPYKQLLKSGTHQDSWQFHGALQQWLCFDPQIRLHGQLRPQARDRYSLQPPSATLQGL